MVKNAILLCSNINYQVIISPIMPETISTVGSYRYPGTYLELPAPILSGHDDDQQKLEARIIDRSRSSAARGLGNLISWKQDLSEPG